MGAISLYRGNLHRVPDVPRRWLRPTPKISLKDFRSLLSRRSKALSLLRSSVATTSNPNPNPIPTEPVPEPDSLNHLQENEAIMKPEEATPVEIKKETEPVEIKRDTEPIEIKKETELDAGDCASKPNCVGDTLDCEKKQEAVNGGGNLEVANVEKPDEAVNPKVPNNEATGKDDTVPNREKRRNEVEATGKDNTVSDREKRRKEVEEKLQVLNEKKHNLVQVLKQILNVEEELKRRNSMHGMTTRPSVPLQVDVTNDSGSMTRHVTPKMGSEMDLGGGEMEGGEAEDVSNHNSSSRYLQRTSSPSPSLESPLRRPPSIQHNALPHLARSSLGTTSSPSRFASTGHQGQPANLPTVSLSGTNYIASSPSPAASGGTSAFRDARQPSPWN